MAHSLSSKKRIRQNIKLRALNRTRRSTLRSKVRKCHDMFLHGNIEDTERTLRDTFKLLDREASRKLLHPNTAARRKSRLARRLNALKQKAAG